MAETESADELRYKLNKAEDFIRSQGFRRCDIAACNCNSWHGGNAGARLDEWREMLAEFDISTNGKTLLSATREALAARKADIEPRLEPGATLGQGIDLRNDWTKSQALLSIAVSLKRLSDTLEENLIRQSAGN